MVAHAGDRFDELVTSPPWDAQLTHCDVNGDGPDIGPINWDYVS